MSGRVRSAAGSGLNALATPFSVESKDVEDQASHNDIYALIQVKGLEEASRILRVPLSDFVEALGWFNLSEGDDSGGMKKHCCYSKKVSLD